MIYAQFWFLNVVFQDIAISLISTKKDLRRNPTILCRSPVRQHNQSSSKDRSADTLWIYTETSYLDATIPSETPGVNMDLALSFTAGSSVTARGIWGSGKCQTAHISEQQDWNNLPAREPVHGSIVKLKEAKSINLCIRVSLDFECGLSDHGLPAESKLRQCPSCGRKNSASLDFGLARAMSHGDA